MKLVEVHDPAAMTALKGEWQELVERCGWATIYQTWEWNEAWWRAYGRGKRLRLMVARDDHGLAGILPMYVSFHLGTPLRRWAFLGTGPSDYLDVIARDDAAEAVTHSALRCIGSSRGLDLADLQQLRPDAMLKAHLGSSGIAARSVRSVALSTQEPCPHLVLPDSWDQFAASIGKKLRSNLGYYDRHLARTYASVETRLATGDEIPQAMQALFDLHQRRWKARLLPGVLGSRRAQAFHCEVARLFHERGWLRIHWILLDGRPEAVLYCYRFRDRYYYYLGGFNPDLSKFSLGTLLTGHAIRTAIAEGCAEFDFLRGHEPYKYRWQPVDRLNERLLITRPRSLRGHAMLRLNRLESFVEHRAKSFAEKRGRSCSA